MRTSRAGQAKYPKGNVRQARDFLDAWYGWRNLTKEKIEDGTEEWSRIQGNLASAQASWITKYNDAARTASADAIRAFLNDNVDDVVNGMMKSLEYV
jgi:hypothetical protein